MTKHFYLFQRTLLKNLPPAINHIFLPPARTSDLPEDLNPQILYPTCVIRSLPHLRDALTSSNRRVSALVMDLFAPFAVDVAKELGIQSYIFYNWPASELALCIDLPNLDGSLESEFRDLSEPLKIPGSDTMVDAEDNLPDSFHDRSSGVYKMLVEMARKYQSADGIIVNTFLELEKQAFEFMEQHRHEWPPVYAVGPLIRLDSDHKERHIDGSDQCMKWLSNQPRRSVLYVSFGSGASLSREQFDELALGLEMSRHRFLWVVRSPQDDTAASYLNTNRARDDPLKFLPLGFLARVGERGLLVIDWAPQIEILSHESIGGYMTHCGWNSILESVVFGVPLIARPLQNTNAVLVTDCLEVGIRVKENEKGIVGIERRYCGEC